MVSWLLWVADSKTSLICFCCAGLLLVVTKGRFSSRPAVLHVLTIGLTLTCFAVLFLGVGSAALGAVGRDSSLTGRTDIWRLVLRFAQNPFFGEGYETFWIGERLNAIWKFYYGLNQCHNGYLEIYVNLGWVGVALLASVIITGYRRVMSALRMNREVGQLCLAYFFVAVVHNFTEASFKMMAPIWILLLISIMASAALSMPWTQAPAEPPRVLTRWQDECRDDRVYRFRV